MKTKFKVGNKTFNITLRDVLFFKGIVTLGILAVIFLPGHLAIPVSVASNLLWLWRV